MNGLQKEQITLLRAGSKSYAIIANTLGLSINTVKSYCRRNNLGGNATIMSEPMDGKFCFQCGMLLKQTSGKKQKRFCSDKCRIAWWNAHPEEVNHKTVRAFTCQTCGQNFETYGKRERKYCSRTCYGKSKAVRHE
ncbi:MAG: RNA polymerase subunit sigma-70 [Syntrophomonas sp.]|nr:RNA polymerase subunit sigma-70 [Syntrophomonas sp.]